MTSLKTINLDQDQDQDDVIISNNTVESRYMAKSSSFVSSNQKNPLTNSATTTRSSPSTDDAMIVLGMARTKLSSLRININYLAEKLMELEDLIFRIQNQEKNFTKQRKEHYELFDSFHKANDRNNESESESALFQVPDLLENINELVGREKAVQKLDSLFQEEVLVVFERVGKNLVDGIDRINDSKLIQQLRSVYNENDLHYCRADEHIQTAKVICENELRSKRIQLQQSTMKMFSSVLKTNGYESIQKTSNPFFSRAFTVDEEVRDEYFFDSSGPLRKENEAPGRVSYRASANELKTDKEVNKRHDLDNDPLEVYNDERSAAFEDNNESHERLISTPSSLDLVYSVNKESSSAVPSEFSKQRAQPEIEEIMNDNSESAAEASEDGEWVNADDKTSNGKRKQSLKKRKREVPSKKKGYDEPVKKLTESKSSPSRENGRSTRSTVAKNEVINIE